MAQLVERDTFLRISAYARAIRRRSNGEALVRLGIIAVLVTLIVLIHRRFA